MKLIAALAFCVVTACGLPQGASSTSASPSTSPLAKASGRLDAQVPVPAGFPADVPVYTKARLTAAAGFPSTGPTSWGMEWQTLDSVSKVQAFYADKLNQGDWMITFTSTANGAFAATFRRKSDSHISGTLAANNSSGVTKILMSLVTPAA